MKTLIKIASIFLLMSAFMLAGITVGTSMNSPMDPHNGWYCAGDETTGECKKNQNVTCCKNYTDGGCDNIECSTNPGEG